MLHGRRLAEVLQGRTDPRAARPGPWRTIEDVELATRGWVLWHNHQPLHGYLSDVPLEEFEARSYAIQQGDQAPVEIK